jgi:hypothetical protein
MISQGPWYALAAPSKQAVRTSVVCVGSRPVLLPPPGWATAALGAY